MPILSASEILDDPEFQDTSLVRIRITETVDQHGMTRQERSEANFAGVVTIDDPNKISQNPDGRRITGAIRIHTTTNQFTNDERLVYAPNKSLFVATAQPPLRAKGSPDYVRWHGTEYEVEQLDDYSAYGELYVAHCRTREAS